MKIDFDCPGCKKDLTLDTETLDVSKFQENQVKNATVSPTQQVVLEKPEEKPKPEVKVETVIEDFKPNYECPNGNCDIGVHKNKNFKKRPKGKCTNCNQFTKHDKGTCPWCKSTDIEALDPEELDELGIDTPTEQEHDHEHE